MSDFDEQAMKSALDEIDTLQQQLAAAEREIEYLSSFIDDRGLTDELWEAIKLAAIQGGDDE